MDNAKAKPNIPIAGPTAVPIEAACTNKVPIIGPVQEKDTNTNVNDIKKILNTPVVESALLSNLLVHDAGNTSSKAPKKETANTTNSKKNRILKIAFVDKSFNALAPKIPVIKNISSGMKVIILTVVISGVAAVLFPLPDEEKEEEEANHEA